MPAAIFDLKGQIVCFAQGNQDCFCSGTIPKLPCAGAIK